jgi:hypothetical protein
MEGGFFTPEKQLLLDSRNAIATLATWTANSSMCDEWDGVSCDSDGRVSRLYVITLVCSEWVAVTQSTASVIFYVLLDHLNVS